jgi:LysR family transcriptional activator of nhaA
VRFRHLNYVHLVYLVAVAREGSLTAAAAALHVSPQTISGQLKTFGERLGGPLTKRVGRGIELTDLGREIATKGAALLEQGEALLAGPIADHSTKPVITVGVSTLFPALLARQWLKPLTQQRRVERLVCVEGRERDLWEQLAVRRVDVVISAGLPPAAAGFHTIELAHCPVALFGSAPFVKTYRNRFARALREAPLLLPTTESSARRVLDTWFGLQGITPKVVGEFDDASLRESMAGSGVGLCFSPLVLQRELVRTYGLRPIGTVRGPEARFFAVTRSAAAMPFVPEQMSAA